MPSECRRIRIFRFVRKVTERARLSEEHHIFCQVGPRIKTASPTFTLEVAMTRTPLEAIIQRCRSLCHQLITGRGEIEEHLNRHEYTLSPEVRIELERRCEGQYSD